MLCLEYWTSTIFHYLLILFRAPILENKNKSALENAWTNLELTGSRRFGDEGNQQKTLTTLLRTSKPETTASK